MAAHAAWRINSYNMKFNIHLGHDKTCSLLVGWLPDSDKVRSATDIITALKTAEGTETFTNVSRNCVWRLPRPALNRRVWIDQGRGSSRLNSLGRIYFVSIVPPSEDCVITGHASGSYTGFGTLLDAPQPGGLLKRAIVGVKSKSFPHPIPVPTNVSVNTASDALAQELGFKRNCLVEFDHLTPYIVSGQSKTTHMVKFLEWQPEQSLPTIHLVYEQNDGKLHTTTGNADVDGVVFPSGVTWRVISTSVNAYNSRNDLPKWE